MLARQAVLLTPSKSSGPTQLLFYKQNASVSPLFAALTSHPQLTENTAALTPAESALTAFPLASPLESALTEKQGGGGHIPFPKNCRSYSSPSQSRVTNHQSLSGVFWQAQMHSLPPKRKISSFVFNALRTLLQLGGGGGLPPSSQASVLFSLLPESVSQPKSLRRLP